MIIIPERDIAGLVSAADCFVAVEQTFASMAKQSARNFPVIREALGHADALYGFKSGFDRESLALGLKSGGYWPNNAQKGLTNHQSTVFLFDADTGRCRAIVGGSNAVVPLTLWCGLRSEEVRKDAKLRREWDKSYGKVHLTNIGNGWQISNLKFPRHKSRVSQDVTPEFDARASVQATIERLSKH